MYKSLFAYLTYMPISYTKRVFKYTKIPRGQKHTRTFLALRPATSKEGLLGLCILDISDLHVLSLWWTKLRSFEALDDLELELGGYMYI